MPITTDKITYGQSNTPSENHHIDGSTPNVLSIKRGTPLAPGAEVLKINAGVVSFPNQVQTWQDVTASRALTTTYTNLTGQLIYVWIQHTLANVANCQGYVGGVILNNINNVTGSTGNYMCYLIVPAGATYSFTASAGGITKWMELR